MRYQVLDLLSTLYPELAGEISFCLCLPGALHDLKEKLLSDFLEAKRLAAARPDDKDLWATAIDTHSAWTLVAWALDA